MARGIRGRLAWMAMALGLLGLAFWWRGHRSPLGSTPSILLLTLDSTRADHIGCYGPPSTQTPNLDALARDGVLFERAYAQAPLCLPSHATILTGATPRRHGIHDDGEGFLAPEIPTLAESLRKAGYRTAAFVSSTALDHRFGLDRGFDIYDDDLGPPGKRPGQAERSVATEAVGRALAWISAAPPRPFLLWVHLDDARLPNQGYPGQIGLMDTELGKLVAGLRESRPSALVAVVADHGESLGEHGEDTHGRFLYSATTRVPLVLSMPGRVPMGLRVRPVVRSMDVMPTLLELAGVSAPGGIEGASLVPLILARTREGPGPAISESLTGQIRYGMTPVHAVRSGPYLLIHGARSELYDSQQDPQETNDAASRLPRTLASLTRALATYAPDPPGGSAPAGDAADDEEDLYQRYRSAQALEAQGNRKDAVAGYRSILADSPGFVYARRDLSEALFRDDQLVESVGLFQQIVEHGKALEGTYLNLALARYRLKKPEDALEWLQRGAIAYPRSAALHHRTGKVLIGLKRFDEAARELRRALDLEPRFLDAQLSLGQVQEALGDAAAVSTYQRLKELAPASEEGLEAASALRRLSGSPGKGEPRTPS